MGEGRAPKVGPLEGMQEQLPRNAAVERTGIYLPRVSKAHAGWIIDSLIIHAVIIGYESALHRVVHPGCHGVDSGVMFLLELLTQLGPLPGQNLQ